MKLNTYSIIAVCKKTGCMGGAAASYFPGLGAFSPYIRLSHGVIASQGWVNPFLNEEVMGRIERGETAESALHQALLEDKGKELRQISVVDYQGNTAAYTGSENDPVKLHLRGDGYVIAGNILTGEDVVLEMERAFLSAEGCLSDRLMAALLAADCRGGDRRGKMAAVLRVDKIQGFPYIDFRVDDHPEAVRHLNEIYEKHKTHIFETYDNWVENVRQGIKG